MWDLLNQLYKRFGLWVFLAIALAFAVIWGVAHKNAQPGGQVSILGLIKYTKSFDNNERKDDTMCLELQQHFEENGRQQDALRHEIGRLEFAVHKGDIDERAALEQSFDERLRALEQEGNEIKKQIDQKCSNK